MTLALQSPDSIDNIVSVDNAPVDAALLSSFGKYVQGMKKIEAAGVTKQAEADAILKPYEDSLVIRQFLLGNLHRPTGETKQKFKVPLHIIGQSLDNLGDFPFKDPDAVRFNKPTLFVRGTQSKYVPDETIPIIGRFFPRFRMVDIDCGHWVTSEKPEEFRQGMSDHWACRSSDHTNYIHSCCRVSQTERVKVEARCAVYNKCIRVSCPKPWL